MNEIVVNTPSFYVSYNADMDADPTVVAIDKLLFSMSGQDPSNFGRDETALCIKNADKMLSGTKYLILYGDHRQQYKDAAANGGLPACLDYFNANRDQASHASEHEPIEAKVNF